MAERTRKPSSKPPSHDALASLRALLDGLPPEEVKAPRVPIDQLAAEALELAETAESARDGLLAKGLDPQHIDHLPVLARALSMAQADLDASKGPRRSEAEVALEARALGLRSEIVAAGRFALRADVDALAQLDRAEQGKGLAELARNLGELAALVECNARELAKINAEPAKMVARARDLADALSAEVAFRRGTSGAPSGAKEVRDRIASLLIETMAEVRAAGAYAFRKDPALLAKFRSPYNGAKRGRRPRADDQELAALCFLWPSVAFASPRLASPSPRAASLRVDSVSE